MSAQKKSSTEIGTKQVAAYLNKHPDFFESHPDLLAAMAIPHESGEAISLIERQVSVLRDQRDHAQLRLRDLIGIAQDNDQLNERMHQLVLSLFDCDSLTTVLGALHESLIGVFQADRVDLYLFSEKVTGEPVDGIAYLNRTDGELGDFDHIVSSREPTCGRLTTAQLESLYGEAQGDIGSAAVVPLTCKQEIGLLAIGSSDEDRFQHGMGTIFLQQLGELVCTALMRHLDTAPEQQAGLKAD